MSTLINIADAVVTSLNAASFSQEVDAERRYRPTFELAELDALRVSVVPKSLAITGATRAANYFDCAIDVGVQKKIDPDEPAELDTMMNLVEEIADHLRMKRLSDAPEAAWLSIENEPVFAPEHLDQQRVFTSVLTVRYRVPR
ncbi:MAG: hypothetical protein HRF50_17530 [Phycisphaerae bacterium]